MKIAAGILVLLVVGSRIVELFLSRKNTNRLLAAGAKEYAGGHYPFMMAMHISWLIIIVGNYYLHFETLQVSLPFFYLYIFIQTLRVWVLASLGRYFTTRIISLETAPLVQTGPYRYMRHPNYVVVILEIFCLPMVFGLFWVALLFSVLNAGVLYLRIKAEEQAISSRR